MAFGTNKRIKVLYISSNSQLLFQSLIMVSVSSVFLVFTLVLANLIPTTTSQEMTDPIRAIGLDSHNNYRSTVALGKAVNKNGTYLPMATDMYALTWSRMVERYAQELAKSCNFNHK